MFAIDFVKVTNIEYCCNALDQVCRPRGFGVWYLTCFGGRGGVGYRFAVWLFAENYFRIALFSCCVPAKNVIFGGLARPSVKWESTKFDSSAGADSEMLSCRFQT